MVIVSRNCWSRSSVCESGLLDGGRECQSFLIVLIKISRRKPIRHCSSFVLPSHRGCPSASDLAIRFRDGNGVSSQSQKIRIPLFPQVAGSSAIM